MDPALRGRSDGSAHSEEAALLLNSGPVVFTLRKTPPLCVITGFVTHVWNRSSFRVGLVPGYVNVPSKHVVRSLTQPPLGGSECPVAVGLGVGGLRCQGIRQGILIPQAESLSSSCDIVMAPAIHWIFTAPQCGALGFTYTFNLHTHLLPEVWG